MELTKLISQPTNRSQPAVWKTIYYTILPTTQNEPDQVRREEKVLGRVNNVWETGPWGRRKLGSLEELKEP